ELPEAGLQAISQHLESCPGCEAFLDSLDGRTDSAIAALRYPGSARDLGRIHALTAPRAAADLPAVAGVRVFGVLGGGAGGGGLRGRGAGCGPAGGPEVTPWRQQQAVGPFSR